MRTARLVTRAASLVALLLAVPGARATAQGFDATPRPGRTAPLPGESFVGPWRSTSDTDRTIAIDYMRDPSVLHLVRPSTFEATGFVTGNEVVMLTRTRGWNEITKTVFNEMGVLRLELVDPTTLRARFFADLNGAATREETWRRPPPPLPRAIVRPDGLPAFGEYVYVQELPEAMNKVAPVYPDAARKVGIEGQVLVQALVGTDGLVKDTRVVKSIPKLDAAAVAAVRQWRFAPALTEGRPVAVWLAVPVKFALH